MCYCERCTYWCNSESKYENLICGHVFTPNIAYTRKKKISLIIESKRQEVKYVIFSDKEYCVVDIESSSRYVIFGYILIAVGYKLSENYHVTLD